MPKNGCNSSNHRTDDGKGRCCDGYQDVDGDCKPIGSGTDSGGAEATSTNATEKPNTESNGDKPADANEKPKKKDTKDKLKDAGEKVKNSTLGAVMGKFGGDAVKFFENKAKKRYRTGIKCPHGIPANACKIWNKVNSIMTGAFSKFGELYQTAVDKAKEKRTEKIGKIEAAGLDKAMETAEKATGGKKGPYGYGHCGKVDEACSARLNELLDKYGGGDKGRKAISRPMNKEQWEDYAEAKGLITIINETREGTKKQRKAKDALSSYRSSPTSGSGRKPGTKVGFKDQK